MCGIAGIIDFEKTITPDVLPRMLAAQRHRGPDSEGTARGSFYHVGMRRLSIIDCEGGDQPIYNEDRSVFVLLNGEIYNYRELRAELEQRGHVFTTHTDTEVLVHLYEDHGIEMVRRLNGMFAFLIADLRNRTFHVVRDRLGIKPLYYSERGGRHTFASELRSMLVDGADGRSISPEALANYFTYLCIPSPNTPFKGVRKIEAAHRLEITANGVRDVQWWRLEDYVIDRPCSIDAATEELKSLLDDSIKLQLRSDVPVGTCLSGGVDSSLVTALAARRYPEKLDTFFAIFEPAEFDERPYARLVSDRMGTRHHEVVVSSDEAISHLPELAWMLDEPHADAAALPTYLVSKLAAQHVKVCLSGLGGDELFGGYARYAVLEGRIAQLAKMPKPLVTKILRPLLLALDPGKASELDWCLANPEPWQAYHRVLRQSTPAFLKQLFPDYSMEEQIGRATQAIYEKCPETSEPNRRMFVDIQLYMNDQLLQMTDRMSMACSLEMRVPLIDHRIVEFSMRLPVQHKIDGKQQKAILRRAYEGLVPREVFDRPKYGFGPPHARWVTSPQFQPFLEETARGSLAADDILSRQGLDELLLTDRGRRESSGFVWMLVCLELWYRAMCKQVSPSAQQLVAS